MDVFKPQVAVPEELVKKLKTAKKVLLAAHKNPDGDAIGSLLGMYYGLKSIGVEAEIFISGNVSDHVSFLVPVDFVFNDLTNLETFDYLLLLDCHHLNRLGDEGLHLEEKYKTSSANLPEVLIVDHHLADEPIKPVAYHVAKASSTGELVFNVLKSLEVKWDPKLADIIWLAIASDTGFFKYNNITPDCLQQASILLKIGAKPWLLLEKMDQNKPLKKLSLLAESLSELSLYYDGLVAVLMVKPWMLEKINAEIADIEGFIEYPRSLIGVKISVLLRPTEKDGISKVSLRSSTDFDVSQIAVSMGGGGHRQAAAFDFVGSVEEALEAVLVKIKAVIS